MLGKSNRHPVSSLFVDGLEFLFSDSLKQAVGKKKPECVSVPSRQTRKGNSFAN